ncbi:unnamed protein product [Closterium sp. NIES-54]
MVQVFSWELPLIAIIGIGCGVLAIVAVVLAIMIYCCCCLYRAPKKPRRPNDEEARGRVSASQASPHHKPALAYHRNGSALPPAGSPGLQPQLPYSPQPPPRQLLPPAAPVGGPPRLGAPGAVAGAGAAAGVAARAAAGKPLAKWEEDLRDGLFRKYSLHEIRAATWGFSRGNFLGEGAFATVYRGVGQSGAQWAVKRSKTALPPGSSGAGDFEKEVMTISRLSHKNLVRLLGYCVEDAEHILVYEYVPAGTLSTALARKGPPYLTFKERLIIALGTAEGLQYLHTAAVPPVIHRDIKPDNILLDARMRAKVADFGLLKFILEGKEGAVTGEMESLYTRVAGTPGYLDPEYHCTAKVTVKGDVYSFGVLLLVLFTGQRAIIAPSSLMSLGAGSAGSAGAAPGQSEGGSGPGEGSHTPESRRNDSRGVAGGGSPAGSEGAEWQSGPVHISAWVGPLVQAKMVERVADPNLAGDYDRAVLLKVMQVALQCIRASSKARPDMSAVVRWLADLREQVTQQERAALAASRGEASEEGEGSEGSGFAAEKLWRAPWLLEESGEGGSAASAQGREQSAVETSMVASSVPEESYEASVEWSAVKRGDEDSAWSDVQPSEGAAVTAAAAVGGSSSRVHRPLPALSEGVEGRASLPGRTGGGCSMQESATGYASEGGSGAAVGSAGAYGMGDRSASALNVATEAEAAAAAAATAAAGRQGRARATGTAAGTPVAVQPTAYASARTPLSPRAAAAPPGTGTVARLPAMSGAAGFATGYYDSGVLAAPTLPHTEQSEVTPR